MLVILLSKKNNSDINKFGQFTITDIKDGKYWYNDRIICDISEQYEWELVEQKPISFDTSTPVSYDDIPFGEKDYELHEFTYSIPEGFHAEIEGGKVIIKRGEQKPSQWNISDYRTWQYIVSDVLTKHQGIGQYLDDGFCKKIAKYMQENWSKKLSLGQNPVWSEEDEDAIEMAIIALEDMYDEDEPDTTYGGYNLPFDKAAERLKSLKERIGG